MRKKLHGCVLAAAFILTGACKKSNSTSGSYYFTFQSGSITYSTDITDSTYGHRMMVAGPNALLLIGGYRTLEQTDSAEAGLSKLATWSLQIANIDSQDTTFTGTYSTDDSSNNKKLFLEENDFHFYTSYDPHQGIYYSTYSLPFSLTITDFNTQTITGYFSGQMVHTNGLTNITDTVTITNGKFFLPL